jgi:hypothetical protein
MKHYLWMVCLLAAWEAAAQTPKTDSLYTKALIISPLALADIDNTAILGGEYRFRDNMAILADVGYVFYSSYLDRENVKKTRGFTIRPAFRFYYGKQLSRYFQIQAFHKQVDYTIHDWLGKESVNGVPAYEQLQDFIYRKKVTALSFMMGRMIPLHSDKWFADIYLGMGLRYRQLGVAGEENSTYTLNRGLFGPPQDKLLTLHVPLGIRIAHTIK